jgi:hypothetical protein
MGQKQQRSAAGHAVVRLSTNRHVEVAKNNFPKAQVKSTEKQPHAIPAAANGVAAKATRCGMES